jgi:hypothetical protein
MDYKIEVLSTGIVITRADGVREVYKNVDKMIEVLGADIKRVYEALRS